MSRAIRVGITLSLAFAISTPAFGQGEIKGVATNFGYGDDQHYKGSTARIGFSLSPTAANEGQLTIYPPLGGSGRAVAWVWGDTLLIISVSQSADTIAWLAVLGGSEYSGVYAAVGGQYLGQGGVWQLSGTSKERSRLRNAAARVPTERLLSFINPSLQRFASFTSEFVPVGNAIVLASHAGLLSVAEQDLVRITSDRLTAYMLREVQSRGLVPAMERAMEEAGVVGEEAGRRWGLEAVNNGALRMSPQDQLDRFRAFSRVLLRLSDEVCVTWASLSGADRVGFFLAQMSDEELQAHAAWQAHALRAELLAERPRMAQTDEVLAESIVEMANALGPEEAARFLQDLRDYEGLTNPEKCWAERAMVRGVSEAAPARRAALAASYFLIVASGPGD